MTNQHSDPGSISIWAGDPSSGGIMLDEDLFDATGFQQYMGTLSTGSGNDGADLYLMYKIIGRAGEFQFSFLDQLVIGPPEFLTRVRDVETDLNVPRFWGVLLSGEQVIGGLSFSETVIRNGDSVLIALTKDEDGDGLFAAQEQQYGSSDEAVDSDGDGLTDPEEAARQYRIDGVLFEGGWNVRVTQRDGSLREYRTYSDPRRKDTDLDGLDDDIERLGLDGFPPGDPSDTNDATDPTLADTDGDGLTDDVDPAPTFAAGIMHVDASSGGGSGLSWANARNRLHRAIDRTNIVNSDQDLTNDISEIWVAQGVYQPPSGRSFDLLAGVSMYGGFEGGEVKRAQRVADGIFNGTILTPLDRPVLSSLATQGATVDGFTLDAAGIVSETAIFSAGSSNTYRNLYITGFSIAGQSGDEGTVLLLGVGARDVFENCTFANNDAMTQLGQASTIMVLGGATPTFTGCTFSNNTTTTGPQIPARGGALFADPASNPTLVQCRFLNNVADAGFFLQAFGGAVFLTSGTIVACEFRGNAVTALEPRDTIWSPFRSGGALAVDGECTILNSVFFGNASESFGGAVVVLETGDARMINCSFSGNRVSSSVGEGGLIVDMRSWDVQALATGAAVGVEGISTPRTASSGATPRPLP